MLVAAIQLAVFHHDDLRIVQQADEPVPGPGEVAGQVPLERPVEQAAAQGGLNADIVHGTDVGGAGGVARGGHHRAGVEQAVGVGIEQVRAHIHPAAKQFHVHAEVVLGALFPAQVLGRLVDLHAGGPVVRGAGPHQRHGGPVANPVHGTGLAGAHAEFEVGHHRVLREELLVGNQPGQGAGGKEAEPVVHGETGRPVGPEGEVQDVAVGPVQGQAGEVGFQGIGIVADAAGVDVGAGGDEIETRRGESLVGIVVAPGAEGLVLIFLEGVAGQGRIREPVPFVVVGDNVVEYVAERVVLLLRQGRPSILVTALLVLFGEFLDGFVVDAVTAHGRGELKALEGFEHQGGRALQLIFVNVVVFLVDDHEGVVAGQAVGAHHAPGPVFLGGGVPGLLLTGGAKDLERAVGLFHLVVAGIGDGGVHIEFQPPGDVVGKLGAGRVFLEICGEQVPFLALIAGRYEKTGVLAAAAHAHVSAPFDGNLAGHGAHPVKIHVVVGDIELLQLTRLGVVVVNGRPDHVDVFGPVGHGDVVGHHGAAAVGAGADLGAALVTALGGNEDDAGVGPGAVNGGGRCVFQHLHAFNVVGVEVGVTLGRDAVHDVKRGGVAGDGTDTADNHARRLAGDAGRRGDADARHAALEGLDGVDIGPLLDLIHPYGGDGGTHQALGGRAVAHHHHGVQVLGLGAHHYVDPAAVGHLFADGVETYVGELQDAAFGHFYGVVAIQVRAHGTLRIVTGDDDAADDGLPGGVRHASAHQMACGFWGCLGCGGRFFGLGYLDFLPIHGKGDLLAGENLAQDLFNGPVLYLHGDNLVHVNLAGLHYHGITELALQVLHGRLDRHVAKAHGVLLPVGRACQNEGQDQHGHRRH